MIQNKSLLKKLCFIFVIIVTIAFLVFLSLSLKNINEGDTIFSQVEVTDVHLYSNSNMISNNLIEYGTRSIFICGRMVKVVDEYLPDLHFYIYRKDKGELIYRTKMAFTDGDFCKEIFLDWKDLIGNYYVDLIFTRPVVETIDFEIIDP